jgi:hypothetical protein
VRLTTTESDSTPSQPLPTPPDPPVDRVTNPVISGIPDLVPAPVDAFPAPTAVSPSGLESPAGADSRRALREARVHRRRIAWLSVAVVSLCLALTIVSVTLARYRTAGPSDSITTSTVSTVHSAPPTVNPPRAALVDRSLRSPVPSRGAPAPEGGNP